jgi:hypothetical protein
LFSSFVQILKDAAVFFSRGTPNLAIVVPAMDYIYKRFVTDAANSSYEPAIRAALGVTKKTLNRYNNMTDDSEVYRVAMGMLRLTSRLSSRNLLLKQFYIHVTNSHISSQLNGNRSGSNMQRRSFARSTTARMHHAPQLIMRTKLRNCLRNHR